ncbi:hypothetical protein [Streptomyces scopuliridis]|uniref:Uncharacterized protein n=1 Tax=Streptomyces scopuliridis TaxID=452529 RepID=A0ACD4ZTY3_9ACTN|nr:hypothetical protein [Streptomyces scopuliridis]WSC01758.1 hypothetical protein OG835_35270 [Streptomyces scopuliridis]
MPPALPVPSRRQEQIAQPDRQDGEGEQGVEQYGMFAAHPPQSAGRAGGPAHQWTAPQRVEFGREGLAVRSALEHAPRCAARPALRGAAASHGLAPFSLGPVRTALRSL